MIDRIQFLGMPEWQSRTREEKPEWFSQWRVTLQDGSEKEVLVFIIQEDNRVLPNRISDPNKNVYVLYDPKEAKFNPSESVIKKDGIFDSKGDFKYSLRDITPTNLPFSFDVSRIQTVSDISTKTLNQLSDFLKNHLNETYFAPSVSAEINATEINKPYSSTTPISVTPCDDNSKPDSKSISYFQRLRTYTYTWFDPDQSRIASVAQKGYNATTKVVGWKTLTLIASVGIVLAGKYLAERS